MGPPIYIGGNYTTGLDFQRETRASMGPPIYIGGNGIGSPPRGVPGSGFNGATDLHRWKPVPGSVDIAVIRLLQWGHRFTSVETEHPDDDQPLLDEASMGPPIYIGGNRPRFRRPRPRRRRLQWGHRFTSVETWKPSAVLAPRTRALQWGHRFTSVETGEF